MEPLEIGDVICEGKTGVWLGSNGLPGPPTAYRPFALRCVILALPSPPL